VSLKPTGPKPCIEHNLLRYWDCKLELDGGSWCTVCGMHWGHRKPETAGPASLVKARGWLVRMRPNATLQVQTDHTMTADQAGDMARALHQARKVAGEMLARAAGRETGVRYLDDERSILWRWHDKELMEGCKITGVTPRVVAACCLCSDRIAPGVTCWRPVEILIEEARAMRQESGVHLMTHTTNSKSRFCAPCVAAVRRVAVTEGVAKPRALRLADAQPQRQPTP
jgi:hypothetical protein